MQGVERIDICVQIKGVIVTIWNSSKSTDTKKIYQSTQKPSQDILHKLPPAFRLSSSEILKPIEKTLTAGETDEFYIHICSSRLFTFRVTMKNGHSEPDLIWSMLKTEVL